MPAEEWAVSGHQIQGNEIDRLIEMVAYYQELISEYPTTMIYHHMLEDARNNLKKAEKESPRYGEAVKLCS